MAAVRSALFSALLVLGVLVYAPLVLLLFFLPFPRRYRFITAFNRFHNVLLARVCGLRYRVEGLERLPLGPCVILAKHQSAWETLAFGAIFPPHTHVLKRELLFIPLFGWALALLRPIALDRGSPRRALEQLLVQGQARLHAGQCVLIFPEGTRTASGTGTRFKVGGAALAVRSRVPVVPVAHNAGSFWPRRSFVKRAGTIAVRVGPPIETAGRTPEAVNRAAESWIEAQMPLLERT